MSTYYEYQDVGVMIAHKLMAMDGWEVFGYHADHSDMMTDYYDPAYWGGIATKNGYTLVVNCSSEAKPEEIRKYNYDGTLQNRSISEKIAKLEQMTMERGASEQEEESAKKMIEKLRSKESEASEKYIVTGIIPGHMANPPRMNWHIELVDILDEDGKPATYRTVEPVLTEELTEEQKRALAVIKKGRDGLEVKPCDKVRALELLGKHLGMFTDKIEANINDSVKNELAELLAQRKARGEPDASK